MSASIDKNHGAGRLRLDHLILRVAEPEASAQFYRRTLGRTRRAASRRF